MTGAIVFSCFDDFVYQAVELLVSPRFIRIGFRFSHVLDRNQVSSFRYGIRFDLRKVDFLEKPAHDQIPIQSSMV